MHEHALNLKVIANIATKSEMADAIDNCCIDDVGAEILRRRYLQNQDFGCIADMVGLSYSSVIKRHKQAASALAKCLQNHCKKIDNGPP